MRTSQAREAVRWPSGAVSCGSGSKRLPCSAFLGARPAALLGLKDKGAALIKVDASARGRTVRLAECDGALESVGV